MSRRWRTGVMAGAIAAFVAALLPQTAVAAPSGPEAIVPERMAALGDSITRGFHAGCGFLQDCPELSWSTGVSSSFDSHRERLHAVDPVLTVADNLAATGAESAELPSQAAGVSPGTGYVTMLIGATDACRDSASQMTPVDQFDTNVAAAMDTLAALDPQPRVFVASIPDLYRLWDVGRVSSSARFTWWLYDICPSMLADPLSTTSADEQRRQSVRQRVTDYNDVLATQCAAYGDLCRYDGGVVFGYGFTLDQLSTSDYFHPNEAGQAALAAATWDAGFSWVTAGTEPPDPDGVVLDLALSGAAEPDKRNRWTAVVTATVTDEATGAGVPGASVEGAWSGAAKGKGSCVTEADGTCSMSRAVRGSAVTFTVTDVSAPGAQYDGTVLSATVVAP